MRRIVLGNLTIDRDRFEVSVGSRQVELTFTEFDLLWHLCAHADRVVPRERLLSMVWSEAPRQPDRSLNVHMTRLRKKLEGTDPWVIQTIRKRGYALVNGECRSHRVRTGQAGLSLLQRPR